MSAGETRQESDSIGDIEVPADKYWGAQTQRSHQRSTHQSRQGGVESSVGEGVAGEQGP